MLDKFHFIKKPFEERKNKKKLIRNDFVLFVASFSSLACTSNTNTIKRKMLIKFQPDTTVCRYLFTTKSLYMFRVSQHPSSGVLITVTVAVPVL